MFPRIAIQAVLLLALQGAPLAHCAEGVVPLGAGSYATVLPKGAKGPPAAIWATENVTGKMATNGWWSSLAWMKFSERQYPHPLAVQAEPGGLRVYYPGNSIAGTKDAIFGFMPAKTGDDLILGHSVQDEFPDALVDGWSDWFVSVRFASGKNRLRVSYGHGSPFVYALYEGGTPRLDFPKPPQVWSGDAASPVLGVTINRRHYGLFGPSGSTWAGLGSNTLTNQSTKSYFSLAVLPDATEKSLSLFRQYAHSHVTDTKVGWAYGPKSSLVTTTFTFTTQAREPGKDGTLFALYPHQWRNSDAALLGPEYPSVRGPLKLAAGTSFRTQMRFPGVLPALPRISACDRERLAGYLRPEAARPEHPLGDTYGEGKWLGRLAILIAIAEQYGFDDVAQALRERLRKRLEGWLTAAGPTGQPRERGLFYYDGRWGTLIGYPAGFGSDTELNDHHFHYGYFIRAAAEVARHDPAWAADERWGGMLRLLIRDIASGDRRDRLFPFLRCFDPYAGHSWASGHARFGDGNNQESSSEAMNAWCGMILLGEAIGDTALRDRGIFLYTTEMAAIQEYWFDVHRTNFPPSYLPSLVAMVWGGKGANGTWFSGNPIHIHGINWLPIHAGSLYLGQYPAYVERNYQALVREKGGTNWDDWPDLIWMYRALADPEDAVRQFEAAKQPVKIEGGNSLANLYTWLYALRQLGQVDLTVTADYPLYAVFRKGNTRTYIACNMGNAPRTVLFSDGFRLQAAPARFSVGQADR